MLKSLFSKKHLSGFRLIEVEKGKETEVYRVNLSSTLKFHPRNNCDYITEAIYKNKHQQEDKEVEKNGRMVG